MTNAKALDIDAHHFDFEFSPTSYRTMRELTMAFNFVRFQPNLVGAYEDWQVQCEQHAKSQIDRSVAGRDGQYERIAKPRSLNGTIVCGPVSKSENYNKKVRALDRRVLAIETESGGVFQAADEWNAAALTIRGISDYADARKGELEADTKGLVRQIAARNAASFLKLQLRNDFFLQILKERRFAKLEPPSSIQASAPLFTHDLAAVLQDVGREVDERLRELSPEFKLKPIGYRLPIPRVRQVDYESAIEDATDSEPMEIRDALSNSQFLLLNIPRTYPDHSLPWVIADDLLTANICQKQGLPIVVDGNAIRPPKSGLTGFAGHEIHALASFGDAQLIVIVENVPLDSKTRLRFLIDQIRTVPNCKVVFLARGDVNLILESELITTLSAHIFELCDISFREMAHFLQKNFDIPGSESEVIALRLHNIFNQFKLSAHPTYFAGIPREMLSALLQANRRAELIQLAVDGFLTFVVASDRADIALSRTTRSRFLRKLTVALRVERQSFDQEQLIAFTRAFSRKHDFEIDPIAFIQAFVDKGILHFEGGTVVVSLPFVESYLLALELNENDELALRYFQTDD